MIEYNREKSPLYQKSKDYASRIMKMVDYLQSNRSGTMRSVYNQILRSGTSIFANVSESQFAQSQADFITKLHIALKEANETNSWLVLLESSKDITEAESRSMKSDCSELIAMLVASLKTSKKNNSIITK